MNTIFRYAFRRSRSAILCWGLGMAALALYTTSLYDTLVEQKEAYQQFVNSMPPQFMAFFGGMTALFTPAGYLNTYFYSYMPIIFGIFAVLAGSGLLIADEEQGTLDLIMAHPVSRPLLFAGRLLSLLAGMAAILAIVWAGFIVYKPAGWVDVGPLFLLYPLVSLLAAMVFFACLALCLSILLPSRGAATAVAGLLLVGNYFLTSLANLDPDLTQVVRFTPLNYYQGGNAVNGLAWNHICGLLGAALILALLAGFLFDRRDIRLSGGGEWHLPLLRRRKGAWQRG